MSEGSIDKLLRHIPSLRSGSLSEAQSLYISTGEYPPLLKVILSDLRSSGVPLESFDWLPWSEQAQPYLRDPYAISNADFDTVRRLASMVAEADRFNKSLLPHLAASGFLLSLLLRIEELGEPTIH